MQNTFKTTPITLYNTSKKYPITKQTYLSSIFRFQDAAKLQHLLFGRNYHNMIFILIDLGLQMDALHKDGNSRVAIKLAQQ